MADDYKISAKITADTSGFTSGLKNISSQLGSVSSSSKSFTSGLASAFASGGPILVGIALASKALKEFTAIAKETTELYKIQAKAEIQLETASKNNPLINGEAVKELKEFASQMQKTSVVGDETIIQLEAQLASTGRTTEEIEKIIQTALDVSATGTMDLKTAVTQLNATMNGSIGRLGQQNAELKTLTEEELKAGKAVEILGDKYKGMAKSVADSVGSSEQLKNAWSDLKEEIGAPIEDALKPIRASIQKTVEFISGKLKELRNLRDQSDFLIEAEKAEKKGVATTEQKLALRKEEKRQNEELLAQYKDQLNNIDNISEEEANTARKKVQYYTVENGKLDAIINQLEKEEAKRFEISKLEEDDTTKIVNKTKTATDVINESTNALNRQIEVAKIEAKIKGKEFTAQDEMNLRLSEYTKLLGNSEVAITEETEGMKEKKDVLLELVEAITKEADEQERKNKADEIAKELREKEQESLKKSLENVSALKKKISDDEIEQLEEYSDLWIEKKTEQIRKEKEEALAEAKRRGATKEELLLIEKSYNNELTKIYKEAGKRREEEEKKEEEKRIQSVKDAIKTVISLVSKGIKEFSKVFSSITKVTEKVIKGMTKVIEKTLSVMFNSIKRALTLALNGFKKLLDLNISDATDTLLEFEDSILTFFVETLPQLPHFVKSVVQSIAGTFSQLPNLINLQEIFNGIKTIISDIADWIGSEGFLQVSNVVINSVSKILEQIFISSAENFPKIADNLISIIENLINSATGVIETFIDSSVSILSTFIEAGGIDRISTALFNGLTKILDKVANDVLGNESIKTGIAQLVQNAFESLPSIVESCVTGVLNLVDAVTTGFNNWVTSGGAKELGIAIGNSIYKALNWISTGGMTTLDNLLDGVLDILDAVLDSLGKWVSEGGVKDVAKGIVNMISKTLKWIAENGDKAIDIFFDAVEDIILTITDSLPDLIPQLVEATFKLIKGVFTHLPEIISNVIKSLWNSFDSLLKGITEALEQGAKSAWNGFTSFIKGIFGFATGTNNAPRGLALVGEQGPELVDFNGGERVYTANNTARILGSSSSNGNTFNVTFNNTTDTSAYKLVKQLKTYNREMAINGVI